MAYSPIEDKYLSALTAMQFPEEPPMPEPTAPEQAAPAGQQPGDVLVAEAGSRGLPESAYSGEPPKYPRMEAYDPTIREKLSSKMQNWLESMGVDRYKARQNAQTFMGGGSSNLPLTIGIADFLPFVGTGLQTEEAARLGSEAVTSAQQGNYGTAAVQTGGAVLGMVPGVAGTVKAGKTLVPKAGEMVIKSMEKLGTPVQMNIVPPSPSTATKALAPASDLGFYSAVEKAALNVQRKSGTGQSFLNDITKGENVKADEIKWIGLDDFLKGKKNVTKEDVQNFIAENKIDLKEVTLGGAEPFDAQRLTQLESEYKSLKEHPIDDPSFGEEKYNEMIKLMNIRDQSTVSSLYDAAENAMRSAQRAQQQGNKLTAEKYWKENELLNTRAEKLDLEGQGIRNPPKFDKYTLPGGENYREILLTLPTSGENIQKLNQISMQLHGKPYTEIMGDNSKMAQMRIAVKREYRNQFGESGQTAQERAFYKSSHWNEPNVLAHLRVNDRVDADGKKMLLIEEVQSDWHQAGREKGYENPKVEERRKELEKLAWPYMEANKPIPADIKAEIDALPPIMEKGVPDAPFKETWYQLALKRALRYAADNGYDRVGLTTGKQQAERYDLAKQVDEVIAKRNEDGTFNISATMVDGGGSEQSIGKNIPVDKLSDYVGKDLAKSIQTQEFGTDVYSGDQLKVGGEGMKKYYDDIYPKYLDKYGKKWGASVGETRIKTGRGVPGGEPVRYLDITPEMRKSVQKGQPLAAVSSETTVA